MKTLFTQRELSTMLAALRHWQREGLSFRLAYSEATDEDNLRPLSDEEIDSLCERINVLDDQDSQGSCWLLEVRGALEPVLMGPYETHEEMVKQAKAEFGTPQDSILFKVELDETGAPEITPLDTTSLHSALVAELGSAISRGEIVISRIATSKFFTYRIGADDVVLSEAVLDELEDYLRDTTVIIDKLTESYILTESLARFHFTKEEWMQAVNKGETEESFSRWQWTKAESLPRARSIFDGQSD